MLPGKIIFGQFNYFWRQQDQSNEIGHCHQAQRNISKSPDNSDLKTASNEMNNQGLQPVVLVSPTIRAYFKKLIEPSLPNLPVVSYNEIPTSIPINTFISIGLNNE